MIYHAPDIPLDLIHALPDAPKPKGNPGRKKRPDYKAVVCAFDIETTALKRHRQSFMYIWQLQIGFDITIIGRNWTDFLTVLQKIQNVLHDTKLVTYVHNLSFEFQFLSGIWYFTSEDVFCTEPRQILHADMGPLELRCSYRLSNMSLDQFTRQMKVQHRKLSGEKFDYGKVRYPWTKLSEYELNYATYDVIGLVEAVNQLMINEGDTLYSIPMTSTGYVRRDVKRAMRTYNWDSMHRQLPSFELHKKFRRAFRGGNTHADRHFVGQIVRDVWSWDISSSYPSALLLKEFPVGRWYEVTKEHCTAEYLKDLIQRRHKAVLVECNFLNIRLKDPRWPVPYLPIDKCEHVIPYTQEQANGIRLRMSVDNGRIMAAQYLETTLTDIDLGIVAEEYEWDELEIQFMAFSTYGMLPAQLREVILKYYINKTSLKGIPEKQFVYDADKRKINAIYGCMVQDPIQIRYLFSENEDVPYIQDVSKSEEEIYKQAMMYAYQAYPWGCWTTAHARRKLEDGIRVVYETGKNEKQISGRIKTHFLYCDTDSIKFIGNADISILNTKYIQEAEKMKAYADDPKGKRHYIGVYENETAKGAYPEFLTWGAKKYVYREPESEQLQTVAGTGDTWHITIAGVNKETGARELERAGGINALLPDKDGKPYFVFRESGGIEAVYNDAPDIGSIKIGNHEIDITRNIYLERHPYTLSVTDEFERIINHPDLWRDLIDSHAAI